MNKHTCQSLRMLLAVVLAVCASVSLRAQTGIEYFFDSDPGFGKAQRTAITLDDEGEVVLSVPTKGLSPGNHLFGYRAFYFEYDEFGDPVTHYAPTVIQTVEIYTNKIYSVEYFWDDDPGFGNGVPVAITPGEEISLDNLEIPTEGLAQGDHVFGIRACGENGWGPTLRQKVYVPASTLHGEDVSYVEYFWDTDPGFGKGTQISITPGQDVSVENLELSTDGLTYGNHNLFIRAYGNAGWGPTMRLVIRVEPKDEDMVVSNAEYFWNDDPGFGKATPINITPGANVELSDFNIPSDAIHGDAVLYIRYRGPMGWSPTMAYPVMVDAWGNYTLNANTETSLETRTYQTLADAISDFSDRGISDDITITIPTSNTDYILDASSTKCIQQMEQIVANLDALSTNRSHKTIAFTATEGSGNSLTVTTTSKALPTVVSFFAQTSLHNVTLTIREKAYDFTPISKRHEECCGTTTAVPLSSISKSLKASWKAQPHDGCVLSGYVDEGTGKLPAMTITNNGTQMDSIAYEVTLGTSTKTLYTFTYYIYVHARMENQAFTTLSPANGSIIDPVKTQLQWNAFGDAVSYHLVVTEAEEGADPVEIVNVETTSTSYDVTVKPGYTYTWTVTVIGHCDELTSTTQTFKGRLLPDLVVESIALPEGCLPGSMVEVTATVRNQGTGATTEGAWTDRLYYVLDSSNFSDAVAAADVQHTGNVAAGESYEATFQMEVPFSATSSTLRVFVAANVDGAAMEADATNNRTISTTSATLKPVYMDGGDLAALRQFYADFGGEEWNGTKWKAESELIANGYWSGVSFDSDGHVTAIDLYNRNLNGSLTTATPLNLPRLKTLILNRNSISGDPAKFITIEAVPMLTTLNLSENLIAELSAPLPVGITTLDLSSQFPKGYSSDLFDFSVGNNITIDFPSIMGYNHQKQTMDNHPSVDVRIMPSPYTVIGQLQWSGINECYVFVGANWNGQYPKPNDKMVMRPTSGAANNSAYIGRIQLTLGDANMSGWVDVNDVQRTLNYIIDSNNYSAFNPWCANTWEDERINIQDIVCTVNIVLDTQGDGVQNAPRRARTRQNAVEQSGLSLNRFYVADRYVCLDAQDSISAFDLELEGVAPSQVKLLLNRNDWQMQTRQTENGVRMVVFSPTGQALPTGQTTLLRMTAPATLIAVQATSPKAEDVNVNIQGTATGIIDDLQSNGDSDIYDLSGRKLPNGKMSNRKLPHGVYIQNGNKITK